MHNSVFYYVDILQPELEYPLWYFSFFNIKMKFLMHSHYLHIDEPIISFKFSKFTLDA